LLALPVAASTGVAVGFAYLEAKENCFFSSIGAVGNRLFTLITAATGLVLIVWGIAKVILAYTVNILTFNSIGFIRNIASFTLTELWFTVFGVAAAIATSLYGKTIVDRAQDIQEFLQNFSGNINQILQQDNAIAHTLNIISEQGLDGFLNRMTRPAETISHTQVETITTRDITIQQESAEPEVQVQNIQTETRQVQTEEIDLTPSSSTSSNEEKAFPSTQNLLEEEESQLASPLPQYSLIVETESHTNVIHPPIYVSPEEFSALQQSSSSNENVTEEQSQLFPPTTLSYPQTSNLSFSATIPRPPSSTLPQLSKSETFDSTIITNNQYLAPLPPVHPDAAPAEDPLSASWNLVEKS
jgi:hypothetical protein